MNKKEWLTPTIVKLNGEILTGVAYYSGAEYYTTGACVSNTCQLSRTRSYNSGANYPNPGPTSVSGTCTVAGAACS